MADGGSLFMDALKARVDETLDACTRCGKCVEACPMVEPAGLDPANAVSIVGGVLDLLDGSPGTPDAERWAEVCTNSGKCIPACDYGVNPRFMVNMARIASMTARKGEAEVRRGAQQYFNSMGRSTRIIRAAATVARGARPGRSKVARAGRIRNDARHRLLHRLQRDQDAAYRAAGA